MIVEHGLITDSCPDHWALVPYVVANWNFILKVPTETARLKLALKLGIETWYWNSVLKLCNETLWWNWNSVLKVYSKNRKNKPKTNSSKTIRQKIKLLLDETLHLCSLFQVMASWTSDSPQVAELAVKTLQSQGVQAQMAKVTVSLINLPLHITITLPVTRCTGTNGKRWQ